MKRTIIDEITITREGHLNIRLRKQIVDGEDIYDLGFHRTVVPVGGDVEEQFALVNQHLSEMGFEGIDIADLAQVKAITPIVFTPEKIAAFVTKMEQSKPDKVPIADEIINGTAAKAPTLRP